MEKYQPLKEISILLLGDSTVGKTAIFNKYINCKFDSLNTTTIAVDFKTKTINYKKKAYNIRLYDTAGQERFRCITKNFYHFADGFFLIFDLTKEKTLNSIIYWIESVKELVKDSKFIILGNKSDLNNQISDKIIDENLKEYKDFFIKTSALKDENIDKAFKYMIDLIEKDENSSNSDDTTEYEEDIQKDKKGINKNIYLPKKNSIILKRQKINNDNQANKCC